MKRTRQSFLVAGAAMGAGLISAGATPAPSPKPIPVPSPAPSATPPPSPNAHAQALAMRRFDAKLSDDEITTIAGNIDQAYAAGASLNPRGTKLHNGDAPEPEFRP